MKYSIRLTETTTAGMALEEKLKVPSEERLPVWLKIFELVVFVVFQESSVFTAPRQAIAIFHLGLDETTGAFDEDATTLHLDTEVKIDQLWDALRRELDGVPQKIAAAFLETRPYAWLAAEDLELRIARYNFPRSQEKREFYARNFTGECANLIAELLLRHRQYLEELSAEVPHTSHK